MGKKFTCYIPSLPQTFACHKLAKNVFLNAYPINVKACCSDYIIHIFHFTHNPSQKEGTKEMFYLTTHSTHFIYGYMASDIWLRTTQIVRKETRCHHIGYSFRLAASNPSQNDHILMLVFSVIHFNCTFGSTSRTLH